MLEALIGGTTDPNVLAELARGRLRAKLPALRQALAGRFRPHHAFLVTQLLAHLDHLDELIATVSGQVDAVIAPFAEELDAPGRDPRGESSGPRRSSWRRSGWTCAVFPSARPSGELGRSLPGQQRECRQAPVRESAQREPVAAQRADRGRAGLDPRVAHRLRGALSTDHAASRPQEGRGGGRACVAHHRLSSAGATDLVPGLGHRLLRPSACRARSESGHPHARASGVSRDSRTRSLSARSHPGGDFLSNL